ncbi:MBL fold metallo-hydrolase [Idiomarina seosinensis]|uniref:MBL fold metallo-hydrolase n=1 Tax=Idiomarina seosinensis TaxID=281739 RepID=UPI00384D56E7
MSRVSYVCSVGCWLAVAVLLISCSSPQYKPEKPWHTAGGFQNTYAKHDQGFFDYWHMRWFGDVDWKDQSQQAHLVPQVEADLRAIQQPDPEKRQVTWIGHSTFLLQYQGLNVLTDPIFSKRASPVSFLGPSRLTPLPLSLQDLPPIDAVIISHDHYDHLDADTIHYLGSDVQYYVPLRLKRWFVEQGIDADKVTQLDWWQSAPGAMLSVHATPSQHWSGRGLWDRFETLWASYVIDIGDWRLWFGGDTGYNEVQFKEIGEHFGPIDLALNPVGAYLPRWFMEVAHVDPAGATLIHKDIGARQSVTMHWGSFQLAAEGIQRTLDDIAAARQQAGLTEQQFQVMAIGETQIF